MRLGLGEGGKHLWTRDVGRQWRTRLEALLDGLAVGGTVVIDAKDVEVFDYSFANEFFGKILLSLPGTYPGRFLIVEHLSDYARENLEKALESLALAIIERRERTLQLLGKVHPSDQITFTAIVQARQAVTAAVLRDQLGINLTAVNERLAKLTSLGLVRREKSVSAAGREQYVYSAPS